MSEPIKFFLTKDTRRGAHLYKNFSPACASRWDGKIGRPIVSVDEVADADYLVIINNPIGPEIIWPYEPHRILMFKRDPDEFAFVNQMWSQVEQTPVHKFPISSGYMLQHWLVDKTYDELAQSPFPDKSKDLSWVTTNYGDGSQDQNIQILSGHKLRMEVLREWLRRHPDGPLDLFGKRLYGGRYQVSCNKGELYDKWDGLARYRYTLALENSAQPGYFSEKFCDAVLAGCMPIYWGCPNIAEFFPRHSYVGLPLESMSIDQACDFIEETIKTDYRERHLMELAIAKKLVLDRYNIWPTLHGLLNRLAAQDGIKKAMPGGTLVNCSIDPKLLERLNV